jgi:hypothetical protein
LSLAISQRHRRTYFNNPLVEESLRYLPAAIDHPTSLEFRAYLAENLHHSSVQTRKRFAEYIAQRFSQDGQMNLALARALAKFGDSRTGREIFYFELLQSAPVLHDIASLWLAEQPEAGAPRSSLLAFLEKRLGGKSADHVAGSAVAAFRRCRKLTSPKPAIYIPVWSEPPLEAFLYVLARLYRERTMVRFDLFAGLPVIRALLWPRPCLATLLEKARQAGHISKVSELDQYHQFTLADDGAARLGRLVDDGSALPMTRREPTAAFGTSSSDPAPAKKLATKPKGGCAVPTTTKTKKTNSKPKAKGGQKVLLR